MCGGREGCIIDELVNGLVSEADDAGVSWQSFTLSRGQESASHLARDPRTTHPPVPDALRAHQPHEQEALDAALLPFQTSWAQSRCFTQAKELEESLNKGANLFP